MSSTSRLQQTIQHYRAALLAQEATAAQRLDRAYQHVLAQLQPHLNALYDAINKKMASGEKIPASWIYERDRLQALKHYVSGEINHFGMLAYTETHQLQQMGVSLGMQSAQALLRESVPPGIHWSFGVPSQDAIERLIGATQKGSPLADLFAGFGSEAATKVGDVLVTGLSLGNGPREVARDVQAALGISRNRALVLSRDQLVKAYRGSALENYRANSDVVSGWIWVAAMGACAACSAMNGSEFSLDEELDDHVCGRCARVPKTRDWSEILGSSGIDTSGIEDTSPTFEDGSDAFANFSEEMQRQSLGSNAAYELYSSGQAILQDFVGYNDDPGWGRSIYQKSVKQIMEEDN